MPIDPSEIVSVLDALLEAKRLFLADDYAVGERHSVHWDHAMDALQRAIELESKRI